MPNNTLTTKPPEPITGYRSLSSEEVGDINVVKAKANEVGALLDDIAAKPDTDQRWIAIARTNLQQGFMAFNRAIARPESF